MLLSWILLYGSFGTLTKKIIPNSSGQALLSIANETSNLWHEIFGHMNYKYIQALKNDEMVEGLPPIKSSNGA